MATKVLVHLNHGSDQSYLLTFGEAVSPCKLRAMVNEPDSSKAIRGLMALAANHTIVSPRNRRKAEAQATFIVSRHGYTLERLG